MRAHNAKCKQTSGVQEQIRRDNLPEAMTDLSVTAGIKPRFTGWNSAALTNKCSTILEILLYLFLHPLTQNDQFGMLIQVTKFGIVTPCGSGKLVLLHKRSAIGDGHQIQRRIEKVS